jgi:DNA mismatch endonuclease Vsr
MADPLTPARRSALMSRVKTRETAPELELRHALWAAGIRGWRLHPRAVPGRPDLAWIGRRLAVFVDGAFWHGHPDYYWGQSGKFWDEKIARNRERDVRVTQELVDEGWRVLRLWDFEVEKEVSRCTGVVRDLLKPIPGSKAERTATQTEPMTEPVAREEVSTRLREIAEQVGGLADAIAQGEGEREAIDEIVAGLRATQSAWFGARKRAGKGKGAKSRILDYLLERVGEVVQGEELAEVSGIHEWPRRIRELRVQEGYEIAEVGSGTYRLESAEPNADRASAWRTANAIRRRPGSASERIAAFLEANVGNVVTRDDVDYVARIAEGSRRVRELRDELGWPINSHIDEPGLEPGEYRLTSADPADRRDPLQRLYPESVRQKVFERDGYTCQACGRDPVKAEAAGDTRFYLEVHHKVAVADELEALPKSERNRLANLVTLCHTDHRRETAKLQRRKRRTRSSGA